MTKKFIGILILSIIISKINAQNAYYDAIKLSTLVKDSCKKIVSKDLSNIAGIFKAYMPDRLFVKSNALKTIINFKEQNPFFTIYFNGCDTSSNSGEETAPVVNTNTASFLSSTGGFSAPIVASALTDLIIKRAKQELTVAFFDKFKSVLRDNPEIDSLFPKTSDFINNIESYLYASFLNTLRQAFADDISNLVANIPAFLRADKIKKVIGSNPKYQKIWLTVPAFNFIGEILSGGSAIDAVKKLDPDDSVKSIDPNLYSALQLITVFSESLRDVTGKSDWVDLNDFTNNILNDPKSTNLYFGLLYQEIKNKNITFKGGDGSLVSVATLIPNSEADKKNIEKTITDIITGFNNISSEISVLNNVKKQGDSITFKQSLNLINVSVDNFKTAFSDVKTLFGTTLQNTNTGDQILSVIPPITQIVNDVYDKQYSDAVMNSIILLNHYIQNDEDGLVQKFVKYGTFMASIAAAKTSDDVETALEAAILPVGSSSIKQKTAISIAINSYIGLDYYSENYSASNVGTIFATPKVKLPTFGVGLPIGVTFSLGAKGFFNFGGAIGSYSLFVSVIDLGAVASFQLSTPDSVHAKPLPQFTWQNLLAPGGYFILGRLFNTPLAIGFGGQKGPALRNINYGLTNGTTVDISNNLTWRFGAFLSVDIPLFNLYSKEFKKPD